jgi:hypothetical protein
LPLYCLGTVWVNVTCRYSSSVRHCTVCSLQVQMQTHPIETPVQCKTVIVSKCPSCVLFEKEFFLPSKNPIESHTNPISFLSQGLPSAKEQVPVPNHLVHWVRTGWVINVSHGCRGRGGENDLETIHRYTGGKGNRLSFCCFCP